MEISSKVLGGGVRICLPNRDRGSVTCSRIHRQENQDRGSVVFDQLCTVQDRVHTRFPDVFGNMIMPFARFLLSLLQLRSAAGIS